ncbi:MAG: hypothetical protein ACOZIN_19640 [Myxococcota bacterium]
MQAMKWVVTALVLSTAAFAQEAAPSVNQSVLAGKVVGQSSTVLHGEAGWPGLSMSVWRGAGPKLDIGGKASLLYGYEGITQMAGVPGIKLQGLIKLSLLDRNKINLGLKASPGMFFYFFPGITDVGITLPLDLTLGFAATPSMMLNVGMDMPMFVVFGTWGGMVVPVRLGAGLEYFLDRTMALTLNLRAGPVVNNYYYPSYSVCFDRFGRGYRCGGPAPAATAEMLVGLSYRL